MIEHMNHAGTENGELQATHAQLRNFGLSANAIRDAIEEASFLGLLRYRQGGRWAGSNQPSRFRLTFIACRENFLPTNEWERMTAKAIEDWKTDRAQRRMGDRKRKAARKRQRAKLTH